MTETQQKILNTNNSVNFNTENLLVFEDFLKSVNVLNIETLSLEQKKLLVEKLQEKFSKDATVQVVSGNQLFVVQGHSFIFDKDMCQNLLSKFFDVMKSSFGKEDFIEILKLIINTGVLSRD